MLDLRPIGYVIGLLAAFLGAAMLIAAFRAFGGDHLVTEYLTGLPGDGETYTRGTPNMWSSAAGDEKLGYVYVPLGNSAVDYYGGNRKACENEYSSALVAIDVTTGKEAWHFQTVHYDVWDYDLGSQPTLVDFPTDDGTTPAVILPSKQGQLFVLDRETGEPLVPVEERKVPTTAGVEPDAIT